MKTAEKLHAISLNLENGEPRYCRDIYTVQGSAGLWQRMPRERRSGLNTPHGTHIVAHDEEADELVELKRAAGLEFLLHGRAGLELACEEDQAKEAESTT